MKPKTRKKKNFLKSQKYGTQNFRKYDDFYTLEDITEPKSPEPNITIENFDSNGEIASPTAPCLAVTIDPEYIKDCKKRPKVRKFLVKSDILKYREITRTKYFAHINRKRELHDIQEQSVQDACYYEMKQFCDFCYDRLKEIETVAFAEMEEEHKKLKTLELTHLKNELKELESEYQQIYMSLIEMYERFQYLLKLVGYFDTVSPENYYIEEVNALMTTELKSFLEEMPDQHGKEQMLKLQNYMDNQIRPYLKKKNYLNSELWFQGYENIRRKIFNYDRYLCRIALLNHVVYLIYEKYMKVFKYRTQPKIVLVDPMFPKERTDILKEKATRLFDQWSKQYKSNKIMVQYDATISTILSKLETEEEKQVKLFVKSSEKNANKALNVEEKIGKVQDLVMELLHQLDDMPPDLLKTTEKNVRYRLTKQKKTAKNALVLQTRFQNLLDHYRNHFEKQNISKDYVTLIPRDRSKRTELVKKQNK